MCIISILDHVVHCLVSAHKIFALNSGVILQLVRNRVDVLHQWLCLVKHHLPLVDLLRVEVNFCLQFQSVFPNQLLPLQRLTRVFHVVATRSLHNLRILPLFALDLLTYRLKLDHPSVEVVWQCVVLRISFSLHDHRCQMDTLRNLLLCCKRFALFWTLVAPSADSSLCWSLLSSCLPSSCGIGHYR